MAKKDKKDKKEKKHKSSKSSKHNKLTKYKPSQPEPTAIVPWQHPTRPSTDPQKAVVPFKGVAPVPTSDFETLVAAYKFDTASEDDDDGGGGGGDDDAEEAAAEKTEKSDKKEPESWQDRMASKYSQSLYKEFAIIDFTPLVASLLPPATRTVHTVGLRWRSKPEVLSQFGFTTCGNRRCPAQHPATPALPLPVDLKYGSNLTTFEFPFVHRQNDKKKFTVVEVRLCDGCAVLGTIAGKKLEGPSALTTAIESVRVARNRLDERNDAEENMKAIPAPPPSPPPILLAFNEDRKPIIRN